MRKTILATLAIAFIALGAALGVANSDDIKGLFASQERYGKTEQTAAVENASTEETTLAAADTSSTTTETTANDAVLNEQITAAGDEDAATSTVEPVAEATTSEEAKTEEAATDEEPKTKFVVDVARALKDREVGSKSAPLTVYDFSSLTCPHCAYFHLNIYPKVKEKYIDTGKVRWVFRGFPLNDPALKGEMLARCAPEDQYEKLTKLMFENQDRWAFTSDPIANLNMLVRVAGINDDMFLACVNNKDLERGLAAAAQVAGDKYKVASTPTFIFNEGVKNFSGAGSYEGFALDLDQTLKGLGVADTSTTPEVKTEMSTSPKLETETAPSETNPLAPKQ